MRLAVLALSALIVASATAPAFAGSTYEPPDPCRNIHGAHALARCRAHHPKPLFADGSVHFHSQPSHGLANEGWEQDRGQK